MRRTKRYRVVGSLVVVFVAAALLTSCRLTRIIQIGGGYSKTCAITNDATVVCWGAVREPSWDPSAGFGNWPVEETYAPRAVAGITGAVHLGVGQSHVCVVIVDGTVRCWGTNDKGQLGDGSSVPYSGTPVTVAGIDNAIQVSSGDDVSCALLDDHTVRCWGANNKGQLGNGSSVAFAATPVNVSGLTNADMLDVGGAHACARRTSGWMSCWGDNDWGQLGNNSTTSSNVPVTLLSIANALSISAGPIRTCAVRATGIAACWGAATRTPTNISETHDLVEVSVGDRHMCGRASDGTGQCWGEPASGAMGPVAIGQVRDPGFDAADQIVAGTDVTCGRLGDEVRCLGLGEYGELGSDDWTGSATPALVGHADVLTTASSVEVGDDYACAVTSATVRCWGQDVSHLAYGVDWGKALAHPGPDLANVTDLATAWWSACALDEAGAVRCWGANKYGQLGNGTTVDSPRTSVAVLGINDAVSITANRFSACARRSGGTVSCWGANWDAQLGDGTTTSRSTPVTVAGISSATQVAMGSAHACAVLAGGTVSCWGSNNNGQLGDGTTVNRPTPVTVAGVTDATAVVAGSNHSCALRSDQTVVCWGDNAFESLGDGTTIDSSAPVTVIDVSGATGISARSSHTCVSLTDGRGKCWGYSYQGNLGFPTGSANHSPPKYVKPAEDEELTNITSMSAGIAATCARLSDGKVVCWGEGGTLFRGAGALSNPGDPVHVPPS